MNSQSLFDLWSWAHFGSGVLSTSIFKLTVPWAVVVHQLWEIEENSTRMLKMAKFMTTYCPSMSKTLEWDTYKGDSPTNTASDTLFFMGGALTGQLC